MAVSKRPCYNAYVMRKAKLTSEDILKAEQTSDARRQQRSGGFELMKDRDSGAVVLSNGVKMIWSVPRPDFPDTGGPYVYPRRIPEGTFILKIEGKETVFDTEEFRRWLRWA